MEIIDLELKTFQSGHDFQSQGPMTLEDIGQGQRSPHATHLLMLVIICTKYGKNPSRTVDATEGTRFSRPRPNDLEDIGQGQRSLYATHHLILVIICAKYGKNPSWTVDATELTRDAGRTDGRTDGRKPIYPPTTSLCVGYNYWSLISLPIVAKNVFFWLSIVTTPQFIWRHTNQYSWLSL